MKIIEEAVGIRKKYAKGRKKELVNKGTQPEWLLEWKAKVLNQTDY